MMLHTLEQKTGISHKPLFADYVGIYLAMGSRRLVQDEQILVASGNHSRRTAVNELGIGTSTGSSRGGWGKRSAKAGSTARHLL